ncbi:MAG: hypothetical protein ACPF9W_13065, partial [Nocardioides sp.]
APSGVLRSAVVDLVGGDALPVDEELVPDAGTAGRRILVVEDNPVNQMVAGGIEARDHPIGEWLPPLAGMGAGPTRLDGQAGI